MPIYVCNGGYVFSFGAMLIIFFFTLYSLLKLIEARAKVNKPCASYSDIAEEAFGETGRLVADILLVLLQYVYVISLNFFVVDTIRSVIDEVSDTNPNSFFVGKK
jgi:amino acid permease